MEKIQKKKVFRVLIALAAAYSINMFYQASKADKVSHAWYESQKEAIQRLNQLMDRKYYTKWILQSVEDIQDFDNLRWTNPHNTSNYRGLECLAQEQIELKKYGFYESLKSLKENAKKKLVTIDDAIAQSKKSISPYPDIYTTYLIRTVNPFYRRFSSE